MKHLNTQEKAERLCGLCTKVHWAWNIKTTASEWLSAWL